MRLSFTLALAIVVAACGSTHGGGFSNSSSGGSGGSSGGSSGTGGSSGGFAMPDGGVSGSCNDGGTSSATGGTITAMGGPNIVVHGQPATVQLTASAGGIPITGTWTTSNTTIGTVGTNGVFTANGYVGG